MNSVSNIQLGARISAYRLKRYEFCFHPTTDIVIEFTDGSSFRTPFLLAGFSGEPYNDKTYGGYYQPLVQRGSEKMYLKMISERAIIEHDRYATMSMKKS